MGSKTAAETAVETVVKAADVVLTKREIEVLPLLAKGLSSKEIAGLLFVSKRTVDFHLANIYDKLGVKNKVQALNEARRRGLLPVAASVAVSAVDVSSQKKG